MLLVVACGGSSKPAAPASTPHTAADLGPMCDRYFERQRSCTDDYLHALVQMRAEYDMPKGIAAEVKEAGLDAIVAKAKVEWERDTTLEKTTAVCKQMVERTPAQQVERLHKAGEACERTPDCKAFAKCAVDTERSYVKEGRQH